MKFLKKYKDFKGNNEVRLEIAETVFSIASDTKRPPKAIEQIKENYRPFLTEKEPDIHILLKVERIARDPYWDKNIYKATVKDNSFHFNYDDLKAEGDLKIGRVAVQAVRGFGLGDFLRALVSVVLIKRSGFLVHSSGVVDKGKAYLFLGPSGSGKTTVARLSNGRDILNDEAIAFTRKNDQWQAFATPFYGDFGRQDSNCNAPIEAMFFLKKGSGFSHRKLNRKEAIVRMLHQIMITSPNLKNFEYIFGMQCDLFASIPTYELEFKPSASIWRYVHGIS
jgi:hypothetical protein